MRTRRLIAIVAALTAVAVQPTPARTTYYVPHIADLVHGSSVMVVTARRLDVAREETETTRTTWHTFRIEETLSKPADSGVAKDGRTRCSYQTAPGIVALTGELALPFNGASDTYDGMSSLERGWAHFRPDVNRRYLLLATDCGDGTGRFHGPYGLFEIDGAVNLTPVEDAFRLPDELPSLAALKELMADLARYDADVAPSALLVGRIVDAVTGQPVGAATVRLLGMGARDIQTSDDGWFVFRDVRAFAYDIAVVRPGWIDAKQRLRVAAGERRADISVALHRAPGIHGTVRERDGRPLIDVRVSALRTVMKDGVLRLPGDGYEARTDDRGRYDFGALIPGDYFVFADLNSLSGFEPDERPALTFYPPSFYPNGTSPSEAAPVSVRADEASRELDIVVRPVPMRRISGIVRVAGAPVANAVLELGRLDPLLDSTEGEATFRARALTTAADGTFLFADLAPGEYRVLLVTDEARGARPSRRIDVTRGDVAVNFDVLKMPSLVLRAAAVPPSGTARIDGIINETVAGNEAPLAQTLVTVTNVVTRAVRKVQTDPRGTFQVTRLTAGRYEISADRNGYIPLTRDGIDDPAIEVKIGEGEVVSTTLTMRRAGVVSGAVYDDSGNPVAGYTVTLRRFGVEQGVPVLHGPQPFQPVGGVKSTIYTDDAGRYRIFGVPPGEYVVVVMRYAPPPADVRPTRADIEQALAEVRAVTRQASRPGLALPAPRSSGPAPLPVAQKERLPVFHPGTVDPLAAARVKVDSGTELTAMDIALTDAFPVTVSGVVRFERAAVRTNIEMNIERVDLQGGPVLRAFVEDGKFTAQSVAPGRYLITARTEPRVADASLFMAGRAFVEVGTTDVEGVVVTLQPTVVVSGRVTPPQGVPLGTNPIQVSVEPVDRLDGAPRAVRAAADGRFTLRGVVPGRYRIRLASASSAPIPWIVQALDVQKRELPDQILEISASAGPTEVVVHVGTR